MLTMRVEIAKSSRGECGHCHKKIQKGKAKIGATTAMVDRWNHIECITKSRSRKKIAVVEGDVLIKIEGHIKLSKEDQEKVKQVVEEYRMKKARLNIHKPIDMMKSNELKNQLKIRDLVMGSEIKDQQYRLRTYLNFRWCKGYRDESNEYLIFG